MSVYRALSLCLAIGVPQLALAELPVSKQTLGQVDGILKYCAQANPRLAKSYEEQAALLIGKASAQELAEARKSDEYKQAYDSIRDQLSKLDKEHAAEACSGAAQSK